VIQFIHSDKWSKIGVNLRICLGNSHDNFQLHRFTRCENIAKSFRGLLFWLKLYILYCIIMTSINDDAVHVAVFLHLGCSICVAHTCWHGAVVDVQGQHGLICKQAPSKIFRHSVMNCITVRSLSSAGIPASMEPTGLTRRDGKRPDGLAVVPWH